jgi:hypothetical protein
MGWGYQGAAETRRCGGGTVAVTDGRWVGAEGLSALEEVHPHRVIFLF